MRDFKKWFSTFTETLKTYDYYVDFDKIYKNANKYKIELNLLNSLINSKDIENDFKNIINLYPQVMKCIPILLAVRASEIYAMDELGEYIFSFTKINQSPEMYIYFLKQTGLFDLIENKIISNIYDYVLGVEVGLDSNARKNRGGHIMENLVEDYIKIAGFKRNINYFKEMYAYEIENRWNINLSSILNKGKSSKRFDFVISTESCIYAIETNFYNSKGSKLNETARSYKNIAIESIKIDHFKFIWVTDGIGWKNARKNLEETFEVMENIYNINDLRNGIIKKVII